MCVPEACDVRIVIAAILKEKLILLFEIPGRIQKMRVKVCVQRGDARAHGCSSVNVGLQPFEPDCLASRVTKVHFVLEGRMHIVT